MHPVQVLSWLHSIPAATLPPSPPSPHVKRRRPSLSKPQPNPKRPRIALQDLDVNVAARAMAGPATPARSARKSARLSKKGAALTGTSAGPPPRTPNNQRPRAAFTPNEDEILDEDETPRPPHPFSDGIVFTPASDPSTTWSPSRAASASASVSDASSTTSRGRRPRSPVKTMGDLRMVGEGFELKDLATHKGDLDATAREVLAELELIADGEEYVPRAIKDEFEAATEILPLRPYNLADTALSKQHLLAELDEAVEIQQESTRCSLDSVAEPDWNESVHCRILRLALKRNKAVQFRNITRAQIQPPTLIPRLLCGLSIESKMVDYALILPSTDTHISTGIEKLLKAQPVEHQSINQTRYQSVRFQPIALNIETKASNRTESEALVQLTVWTAAGFQQLQVLTASRRPRFIPVPLLMVNGSVWWLLWATWDEADKMTLYSKVQIGDTRELKGIYKLLASMRRLIGWVERVWRPWFTREVLGV